MKRLPFLSLLVGAGVGALHFLPFSEALQFDRAAIERGEFWRLFTGHFLHFNLDHLCWDLAVFVVLGALVEIRSRRAFVFCVVGAVAAISMTVWVFQAQLSIYRGLSGVDSALFGWVCVYLIRTARGPNQLWRITVPALGLVGFLAKVTWEWLSGTAVFVGSTAVFTAVPLAHLIGGATGLLIAVTICRVSGNRLATGSFACSGRLARASDRGGREDLRNLCPERRPSEG